MGQKNMCRIKDIHMKFLCNKGRKNVILFHNGNVRIRNE